MESQRSFWSLLAVFFDFWCILQFLEPNCWKMKIFGRFSNRKIHFRCSKNCQKPKKSNIKSGGSNICQKSSWTRCNHREFEIPQIFDQFDHFLTPHFGKKHVFHYFQVFWCYWEFRHQNEGRRGVHANLKNRKIAKIVRNTPKLSLKSLRRSPKWFWITQWPKVDDPFLMILAPWAKITLEWQYNRKTIFSYINQPLFQKKAQK